MTPHDRPHATPRREAPRPYRPHQGTGRAPRDDVAERILDAEVIAVEVFDPPRGRVEFGGRSPHADDRPHAGRAAAHPGGRRPGGDQGTAAPAGPASRSSHPVTRSGPPPASGPGHPLPPPVRPSAPVTGRGRGPDLAGGAAPGAEQLEDSLNQIERLAAELKEIAHVIDPESDAAGAPAPAGPPRRGPRPGPHPARARAGTVPRRNQAGARSRPPTTAGAGPGDRRRRDGREPGDRRRRVLVLFGAVLLAAPAFALGAVQPWNGRVGSEDQLTVTGRNPTPASPAALAPAPPLPSVAVAGPPPAAAPTAGQPGAGAARRRPSSGPAPDPGPTSRPATPAGLSVRVHASNVRPTVDEPVTFTVGWTDGSGVDAGTAVSWGDGSSSGGRTRPRACSGQAPAGQGSSVFRHTFAAPGRYVVTVRVATSGCDGRIDVQDVPMTLQVAAAPSPTPSPTTPAPTPTGSPTTPPPDEPGTADGARPGR